MTCIILQVENILNYESLSMVTVLLAGLYGLINYIKTQKNDFIALVESIQKEHRQEMEKSERMIQELIDSKNKLQEEKYQITREVIPLLIKLIKKTSDNDEHSDT